MENLSFKQAMERLNYISNKLEENDLELEEALSLFEEGLKLIKSCDTQLKAFDEKIGELSNTYQVNSDE